MSKGLNPVLIFVRGMPGSGKSYLADALKKALKPENVLMLDPDRIDFNDPNYKDFSISQAAEGLDEKIHAFRWLRTTAYKGIANHKVIIWNQPFTDEGIMQRLATHLEDYAKEHKVDLPVMMVEVNVDPDLARVRVSQRKQKGGHGPSDSVLEARIAAHKSFAHNFMTVAVDGDAEISSSVAKVIKVLNDLR